MGRLGRAQEDRVGKAGAAAGRAQRARLGRVLFWQVLQGLAAHSGPALPQPLHRISESRSSASAATCNLQPAATATSGVVLPRQSRYDAPASISMPCGMGCSMQLG